MVGPNNIVDKNKKRYVKIKIYFKNPNLFFRFKKLVEKPSEFILSESEKPEIFLNVNYHFVKLFNEFIISGGEFQGNNYILYLEVIPDINIELKKVESENNSENKITKFIKELSKKRKILYDNKIIIKIGNNKYRVEEGDIEIELNESELIRHVFDNEDIKNSGNDFEIIEKVNFKVLKSEVIPTNDLIISVFVLNNKPENENIITTTSERLEKSLEFYKNLKEYIGLSKEIEKILDEVNSGDNITISTLDNKIISGIFKGIDYNSECLVISVNGNIIKIPLVKVSSLENFNNIREVLV